MKQISLFLLFVSLSFSLSAQLISDKTQESFRASKNNPQIGEVIELIFEVTIDQNWYIYSSDVDPDIGPIPTTFTFQENASYALVGGVIPVDAKEKFDKIWEADITYFEKKALFKQKIKVLEKDLKIQGSFEFQCCSNINGTCLAPETVEFNFPKFEVQEAAQETRIKEEEKPSPEPEPKKPLKEDTLKNIEESEIEENNSTNTENKEDLAKADIESQGEEASEDISLNVDSQESSSSLFGFMILAFLSGLVALLTPCVFPMIPMTVTFFSKNTKKDTENLSPEEIKALERRERNAAIRRAVFYGSSIVAIYTILGTMVSWVNGPAFANWLSTHWIPNVFFFVIFILFAFSFLGMYEIVLPSSWVNKADREADKGGYYGIFFMAFTLALVSFSCTGPIVGSILVQSAGGAIIKPILGMFSFSLAIAIPFALFAAFPSWLNSLPKSGGWLNSVKVVLGFLELALAFKFLSIADQVYHWGILDRDVFLAIWIVIFAMIGFYLLGKIRLPLDSPIEKLSVPRVILATFCFAFVVYMLPGMYGAPLKPLAGYLPPQSSIDFNVPTQQDVELIVERKLRNSGARLSSGGSEAMDFQSVRFASLFELPHGLEGFFDFKQGLAYAEKVNKPIFIDFTGHGCVNCREMEARVWSNPQVLKRLQEEYVVIALYVDDKKLLPEDEWYTSDYDQKIKKTIGAQNADFQIVRFNNNAQPFYTLLDHQGQLLVSPKAYDLKVDNFIDFLDKGIQAFKEKQALAQN